MTDGSKDISEAAKKIAEEYGKLRTQLEKQIELVGLEDYEKKLKDLQLQLPELEKKFGSKRGQIIFGLSLELINREEIERQFQELEKYYRSNEEKIIDASKWASDQINQLTLSDFEYQRQKAREEYAERVKDAGETEDLKRALSLKLQSIDDKEFENKKQNFEKEMDLLREQREREKKFYGTFGEGMKEGFQNMQTAYQDGLQAAQEITQGMTSAFESFFDYTSQGFMNFRDLAMNILNDIYKALMRTLIIQPLVQGIEGLFTSGGGQWQGPLQPGQHYHGGGLVLHSGGMVPQYLVPSFHYGGLNADERAAILQTGEYVVSRRGVAALDRINQGNISSPSVDLHVSLENKSGIPLKADYKAPKFDGKRWVQGIVLDLMVTSPDFKTSFAHLLQGFM
jgi:hypothetical protein